MRFASIAFLFLAITACKGPAAPTTTTTTVDVFTPGNTFSPFSATIPVGGTVRFNISGTPHNVIFGKTPAGAPADVNVVDNVVVPRTFNTRGTFLYDCTVHPGMSGQVVVQ
jgi:plastocyanin